MQGQRPKDENSWEKEAQEQVSLAGRALPKGQELQAWDRGEVKIFYLKAEVCRPTWEMPAGTAETDLGAAVPPAMSPGLGTTLLQTSC